MWDTCMNLSLLFVSNPETRSLMPPLGIDIDAIQDQPSPGQVQKDCLISYSGNQYSVSAEYVGKDEAVVALGSMLAAYYEGKQIALHGISYQRKDMVVNPQHYRRLTLKQTMDEENVLLEQGIVIDSTLKPSDLSRYDRSAV